MCIRDRYFLDEASYWTVVGVNNDIKEALVSEDGIVEVDNCLLYTSDAADERSSVDLGGRRIIKKKNTEDIDMGVIIYKKKYI